MLSDLETLAKNLWWTWDPASVRLFSSIDPRLWRQLRANPIALLADLGPVGRERIARDAGLRVAAAECRRRMEAYLQAKDTWAHREVPSLAVGAEKPVVYLSMEFALHESLRIYSGGLGVLAGDHVRSASDLGLAFIGIGLLYRGGYFRQVIDDGEQVAAWPHQRFDRLPLTPGVKVDLAYGDGRLHIQAWELAVGRVRLILLDTDLTENLSAHREITHALYGGDSNMRVAQEFVLGIGGMAVLDAMGVDPAVVHMNEGHCAFAPLALIRKGTERKLSFEKAVEAARKKVVFTTHTPVPAGHDQFGWHLKNTALGAWREESRWREGAIMDLGRQDPGDLSTPLNMTVLALRTSRAANGVSALHGKVSRQMWRGLWPGALEDEVPIGHITNGVHPTFWMAPEIQGVLEAHLPGWQDHLMEPAFWGRMDAVPDMELWDAHRTLKLRLHDEVERRAHVRLDPDALTIGFARRFAPYKRADLLFRDPERLWKLLREHPVQIVYAGKSHPKDEEGRKLVAEILSWTRDLRFQGKVVFLEEYEVGLGRLLVQGVDLWLNNPRRPREASGTSGQKVALNGGLNCSILDGWWPEAYDGTNGWAIGRAEDYEDQEVQDAQDAASLYKVLEDEIVPCWEHRDTVGLSRGWIRRMKRSMGTCIPVFNTHRMVAEYVRKAYMNGH